MMNLLLHNRNTASKIQYWHHWRAKIWHKTLCEKYLKFSSLKPVKGLSWSYGSWISNYLCDHCISLLKLWVWIPLMERYPRYNIMRLSLLMTCNRSVVFSQFSGFPHNIIEILLKQVLNTITTQSLDSRLG